jgi:hypothetical protein
MMLLFIYCYTELSIRVVDTIIYVLLHQPICLRYTNLPAAKMVLQPNKIQNGKSARLFTTHVPSPANGDIPIGCWLPGMQNPEGPQRL